MSLGERLREARKAKNMTQNDLAMELGISVNSVANYERGTSFPKEDYLYKIINLLELDPNYLFQDNINSELWAEERKLLKNYRRLNKKGRFYVDSIVRHETENVLEENIRKGKGPSELICLDLINGLYGELRLSADEEKLRKPKMPEKADYMVMINGSMEPVIYNGDFISVKYASDIGNMCWGLYNIDGYASIAVKKEGRLYDLAASRIDTGLMDKKPVLYGKIIELHRVSPLRKKK